MSSTDSETASARPARWRALIALFGVAMFVLGVGIGGLGLPRLLALNPAVTPQASIVAQVPLATATATAISGTGVALATPAPATPVPPTATTAPPTVTSAPTAAASPPTATTAPPTATATATLAPTPTVAPTNPASAIFAPDPSATATTATASPTAAAGTVTSKPTTTATVTATTTATASATGTPTVTPTSGAFAATDQIFTELPVNFRAGPGTTYAAQAALPPGTLLAATGETATVDGVAWRQFRLANGTIGWVRAQDVTAVP